MKTDVVDIPAVSLTGQGIHIGERGTLDFFLRLQGSLEIIFNSLNNFKLPGTHLPEFRSCNGTVLESQAGLSYYTPEHLLAVLLPFWNQPVTIRASGTETPIGDGSGMEILTAFGKVLEKIENGKKPGFNTYQSELYQIYDCKEGFFTVEPSDEFSVSYQFTRGDVKETFTFATHSNHSVKIYLEEIIPARTFIFWKEYQQCLRNNLLKGSTYASGILAAESKKEYEEIKKSHSLPFLEDYPYLNRPEYRMENEFARHKILDLMGDLALLDLSLPRLKIDITNGGHFQNHLLIKDLIHERKNQ